MTNYEYFFGDKRKLAELLNNCPEIYTKVDDWFCKNACPHRAEYKIGECHDCLDKTSCVDVILMWLDAECEE